LIAFRRISKLNRRLSKEFHRNLKKEYGRLQDVLQAYALIRPDVRFLISNIDKQGYALFLSVLLDLSHIMNGLFHYPESSGHSYRQLATAH